MNSYANLYVAWATWDREPLITLAIREALYAAIAAQCHRCGGLPEEIAGVADHVHVLARYPGTLDVARLAHDMKGGASHLIRQRLFPGTDFRWQGSYGATSVSPEGVVVVHI